MTWRCQVAVVGGGLAGLAAADYLKRHRVHVRLFEQGHRVGGRVFSPLTPSGQHYEEGALSFADTETTINAYVERFGLEKIPLTPIDPAFKYKTFRGYRSQKGTFLKGEEKTIPLSALLSYYLDKIACSQFKDCSLLHALQQAGASQEAISWISQNTLVGLIGNQIDGISAQMAHRYLAQYKKAENFFALRGGNENLCRAFAHALEGHIHFNFPIKKIDQRGAKVLLQGQKEAVEANCVICALPLTALNQIEWLPSLPKDKKQAFASIGYTSYSRLTFQAPAGFFNQPPRGGNFALTDSPLGSFREQTLFQHNPQGKTIFNWSTAGQASKKIKELTLPEIKERVLKGLLDFIAFDAQDLESYFFSWDHVPWIKGAYSYFPPQTLNLQPLLTRPEGRLYFAGEHTSEKCATMNGALESGLLAAQAIQVHLQMVNL